ncbi:putative nuclease HARBI1 [Sabethes cyaneus]|uniref:putative nuclease HARBI1 n=1 Tax=Sabethes cyaneus TaxID=53552 RepID=UPI00237E1420|nr:putative nuclease HARBI1 [Sabethes cyaneus]
MWSSVDFFLTDDSDEESANVSVMRRNIRDSSNPLSLSDDDCVKMFRLNKEAILYLLNLTQEEFKMTYRNTAILPVRRICASLRFLATGSYQQCVGNDLNLGLRQPVVSKVLAEFLKVMERKVCPLWIKSDMTSDEKKSASTTFYSKSGIPGIIQVIDGTHVKIISPGKDTRHMYYNRKGYYSINALISCDHEHTIRFVEARYPGSYHDAFIWSFCALRQFYTLRNTRVGSREQHFNQKHSKARSIIERVIGILKARFRCLLGARELHYSPKKATSIINVAAALHNICRFYRIQDPQNDIIESVIHQDDQIYNGREDYSATSIRDSIRDCL